MPRSTTTLNYTGSVQDSVVPANATEALVELWGAEGGSAYVPGAIGGKGGYIKGVLAVTPAETLRFYIGGTGEDIDQFSNWGVGGWNGGGTGAFGAFSGGAGGGGATDVRQGGTALANRKAVAAGGGGVSGAGYNGGSGGAVTGANGAGSNTGATGKGGTQSAGGAGGTGGASGFYNGDPGTLGVGGDATDVDTSPTWGSGYGGGGGGGGYYGGGAGGGAQVGDPEQNLGGGGGGSNYTGGLATITSDNRGLRSGHGTAKVTYNSKPTVNVSGPSSAITVARPTVQWAYSDAEGDPQVAYRVKIFSEAQYTAGGFDPETSTPVHDSGKVFSSSTSYAVNQDLVNGTNYRAYVKVWETDFNGAASSSTWDYEPFNVANTLPVCDITAPAGTVNDTSQPTATWTYTDADGDPQTHYQLVLEDGDTTANSAPGAGIWDSGKVASADLSRALPGLSNGQYTLWLKVWHAFGNNSEIQSAWDKQLFTISILPPDNPTVDVTYEAAQARVRIQANTTGSAVVAEEFDVEWLNPDTSLWESVRGATAVVPDGSQAIDVYDYEYKPQATNQYRVRARSYDGVSGEALNTSWIQDSVIIDQREWWLKDPFDPTLNIIVEANGTEIRTKNPRQIAFFNPIGRASKVAVKDVQRLDEFSLLLDSLSQAEHDALEAIIAQSIEDTLLLQSPKDNGEQWYVEIDDVEKNLRNMAQPWHQFNVSFVEVEKP